METKPVVVGFTLDDLNPVAVQRLEQRFDEYKVIAQCCVTAMADCLETIDAMPVTMQVNVINMALRRINKQYPSWDIQTLNCIFLLIHKLIQENALDDLHRLMPCSGAWVERDALNLPTPLNIRVRTDDSRMRTPLEKLNIIIHRTEAGYRVVLAETQLTILRAV